MALTPREFTLLMQAQVERRYDEYEREAQIAIMHEAAHRSDRPKASDLFKRPAEGVGEESLREKAKQAEEQSEWLSQFKF